MISACAHLVYRKERKKKIRGRGASGRRDNKIVSSQFPLKTPKDWAAPAERNQKRWVSVHLGGPQRRKTDKKHLA
ncbi:hypothetical protein FKM82_002573 [Ascaphus truei]